MPSYFPSERYFQRFPRAYADQLIADGLVDPREMLSKCLSWMSADNIREMLDANELSPRFAPEEEEGLLDVLLEDGMIPASEATSADQF